MGVASFHWCMSSWSLKLSKKSWNLCDMSEKCTKEKCSLCTNKFQGWRHRHPESWSLTVREQETVGNRELCVCGACNVSISQALKAKNKCETYQFRWLKNKRVCCVPSCGSTDIEVNVHRHNFSWEDVCNSIGIASVFSPVDRLLCSNFEALPTSI